MNNEKLILEALWYLLKETTDMKGFGNKLDLMRRIDEAYSKNKTKSEEPYKEDLPKDLCKHCGRSEATHFLDRHEPTFCYKDADQKFALNGENKNAN